MISHNKPTVGFQEMRAVENVLKSGQLSQYREVKKFEEEFAEFLNLSDGTTVAMCNGTAALYMSLWVLGARNKNVIFPSYTCSSVRHAVSMVGGKEQLCDIKDGTPNMDLNVGKKDDVVIIPHMYGFPIRFSKRSGVKYIEDACQSLGATIDKKPTGLHGDVSVFSFYATKIITSAGQGGMLVSRDKTLVDAVRDYLNFDCRRDNKSRFNFQMTDIQASMGRVQLKRLNNFVERRKEIFEFYKKQDLHLLGVSNNDPSIAPVPYRCILINNNPKLLIQKLMDNEVQAINPLETWELLGNSNQFLSSIKMSQRTISLPCYPSLNDENLKEIKIALNGIKEFL